MNTNRIVASVLLLVYVVIPGGSSSKWGVDSSSSSDNDFGGGKAPMSNDDYVKSLLDEDSDMLKEFLSDEPMLNDDYVSGDPLPSENVTDLRSMEEVMDMMFKNQFRRGNYTPEETEVQESEYQRDDSKERTSRNDLIADIEKILRKDANATIRIENGILIVEGTPAEEDNSKPAKICGIPINNLAKQNGTKIYENIPPGDREEVAELFQSYSKENITKTQFMEGITKYADKIQCYSTTTVVPVMTSSLAEYQLAEIRKAVDDGYADERLLREVEESRITIDEAWSRLMRDKGFVLSCFPPKIEEMLEDDRIPEHILTVMFSGDITLDELKLLIYQDDSLAKALLPERLREILEGRYPPQELKDLLYEGHNHSTMLKMVMTNDTLLEDLMSESMFYFFTLFKVQRNVILNMALSATTIVALCCVMTSLGCTMTVTEIMKHVRRPKGVIIALVSQYGIMPAAAFGLTQAFDLGVYPAIAVLICGCCPGGNLSNILAFAINGDMNLSILMTTCSSVFGLAMMPFLLFCYSRFIIPIDGAEIVPFDKIVLNIALTIIPVSLGIAIKHYRPTWTKNVMRFGATMLLICSITFSVIAGFLLGDKFFSYFPIEVVICAGILPITGYILGFVFARLVRENQKCSRTISVETGCQNVQLCGTVLKLAFDPILIGAVMLLPIIYMAFQAGEAILLISLYRVYERCTKKKEKTEDVQFDDEEKKLERSDSEIKVAEETDKDHEKENGDEKKSERNGDAKTKENVSKVDEQEAWPLVPKPDTLYLEAFESAKENYV